MIIIAGTLAVPPKHHTAFAAAARRVSAATRAEEGCITYDFWADLQQRGRFLAFEEWESEAHLEAHLEAPHLAEFRATLAGIGLLESGVYRYRVGSAQPL